MPRRPCDSPIPRCRAIAFGLLALVTGTPAASGDAQSDGDSRVQHRLDTIEPRTLLRDSVMTSGRFTGLDRPLDRAAQAATEDRLSWGRSYMSYYPLDSGLWAGVPSESLTSVRGGIGAGQVVDIQFSIGRPAGASGDPDIRSMWQGNATGVDHDALGRAVYGGTASPLEATNVRQLQRATRQDTTVSTAAMSRNASLPVSIAQHAIPYQPGTMVTRQAMGERFLPVHAAPPADSMEHPEHRRARLRAIAERSLAGPSSSSAE